MLPVIKEKKNVQILQKQTPRNKNVCILEDATSLTLSQDKLIEEAQLNDKLKMMYQHMKESILNSPLNSTERQRQAGHQKQRNNIQKKLQQKTRLLNLLLSENNKLKEQVNAERNKRVIYFNVYKNLEHEIHDWEENYKDLLIQRLVLEASIDKMTEKYQKAKVQLEKEINQFQSRQYLQKSFKLDFGEGQSAKDTALSKRTDRKLLKLFSLKSFNSDIDQVEKKQRKNEYAQDSSFIIEEKKIYFFSIADQIQTLGQGESLQNSIDILKGLESQNEVLYQKIQDSQKKIKNSENKVEKLQKNIEELSQEYLLKQESNQNKKQKFQSIENQIQRTEQEIKQLEESLTQFIDFDIKKLANQEILRHTLRVKQTHTNHKKNLEKLLEQVGKEKSEQNQILTKEQLRFSIITSNKKYKQKN